MSSGLSTLNLSAFSKSVKELLNINKFNLIPTAELVTSLNTIDKSTVKVAALPHCQAILKTFSLLCTGFISGEQGMIVNK
jgi:hypothetical protein